MIKEFTYPLPDELYVEGVSGKVIGTYTYDGPEKFDVHVSEFGDVINIDVYCDPELGPDYRKTIDASTNVEVAYFFNHYFTENYTYEYEYEEEVMENSDVYEKPINPDLSDAYELKFNFDKNDWEILQIIKEQSNPSTIEAERRKEYIEGYSSKYSFGTEIDSLIESYLLELDTFIEDNPPLKSWKYSNFNYSSVPKIPHTIAIEFAKIPTEGV
jgi:hypothetical protein